MDKKYEHETHESRIRALWEKEKTYAKEHNPGPSYTIDTPPPTVSGTLHIGHIFSYTQTDIIARYKRMSGYSVFYPFGFDDNGLPTERYVEKKRNVHAPNMTRSEFIALCLEETKEVEKNFEDLWRTMGLSVDWNSCYSTIDDNVRHIAQESFIRLYQKKYIYRKHEPALYCTTCRTSVAQAELDDKEVSSHFNDVLFKTSDGEELAVGTTRPELLPSCVALIYHPDDTQYKHLAGKQAIVPVFNLTVPIIEDDQVNPEKGTGLVMVCTFGDKTDIAWFKKYNLPFKQSVGLDGKWGPDTGPLTGLRVKQAREVMIEELQKAGALRDQKPITHAVNVHERCNREIEYIILSQWFLNILEYKQKFVALADQIAWYPAFMKARYVNWVENLSWDWCISRQRFYGIPFPVWHCDDCNKIILADIKDLPIDPQETMYNGTCPQCSGNNIHGDTDIMDTWNTSSLTPFICQSLFEKSNKKVFEQPSSFLPMSMRPQAHDIIRTWAFYTIVKAWMHHDQIPWKDIIISGHVLSNAKKKISKSKGGAELTPQGLLKAYSPDAIRYWTASGNLGHDVSFSDNQLKIGRRLVTKLWNAFRFIAEHTSNIPQKKPQALTTVNEWILHRATKAFESYQNYLNKNEFGLAINTIDTFFWHDICDNYLELVKDQLFNPAQYKETEVQATRETLYHVGLRVLQLYAPYLPYVTEAIYQEIYKKDQAVSSLHQLLFDKIQKPFVAEQSSNDMALLLKIVELVRKLKTEHCLSLKSEIANLIIHGVDSKSKKILYPHEQILRGITQATVITYDQAAISNSVLEHDDDKLSAKISI